MASRPLRLSKRGADASSSCEASSKASCLFALKKHTDHSLNSYWGDGSLSSKGVHKSTNECHPAHHAHCTSYRCGIDFAAKDARKMHSGCHTSRSLVCVCHYLTIAIKRCRWQRRWWWQYRRGKSTGSRPRCSGSAGGKTNQSLRCNGLTLDSGRMATCWGWLNWLWLIMIMMMMTMIIANI